MHGKIILFNMILISLAKLGIAEAAIIALTTIVHIFFPEQFQRNTVTEQFPMNVIEVWHDWN